MSSAGRDAAMTDYRVVARLDPLPGFDALASVPEGHDFYRLRERTEDEEREERERAAAWAAYDERQAAS